jgi:hypothetical protein
MLVESQRPEYSVFSSGIDWVTCTAKNGSPALALERVSDLEVAHQSASGAKPVHSSWLGFEGYKLKGLFFGRREHDVMLCLSGNVSHDLGPIAIQCATNVSRLDLQVTIASNGEQLELARDAWNDCRRKDKQRGRPRSYSLIVGHPEGQTLYINSRSSDNFCRIYDKGVEAKWCPSGLMWRYEVEFKRKVAKSEALALVPQEQLTTYASDRVHTWLTLRGVTPPWPALSSFAHETQARVDVSRDVLTWYRESLSVSVQKSIKQFGRKAVLEALRIQELTSSSED